MLGQVCHTCVPNFMCLHLRTPTVLQPDQLAFASFILAHCLPKTMSALHSNMTVPMSTSPVGPVAGNGPAGGGLANTIMPGGSIGGCGGGGGCMSMGGYMPMQGGIGGSVGGQSMGVSMTGNPGGGSGGCMPMPMHMGGYMQQAAPTHMWGGGGASRLRRQSAPPPRLHGQGFDINDNSPALPGGDTMHSDHAGVLQGAGGRQGKKAQAVAKAHALGKRRWSTHWRTFADLPAYNKLEILRQVEPYEPGA